MILDLHRLDLSVTAIARQLSLDRKTVRRYIARGLKPLAYTPRPPRERRLDPFTAYLRERVAAYPALTGSRLWHRLRAISIPNSASRPRIMFTNCVRCLTSRSRVRCRASAAC